MQVSVLHFYCLQDLLKTAKKLLKTTRNKYKKYNKIIMLARSKLNSIESKISKALEDERKH